MIRFFSFVGLAVAAVLSVAALPQTTQAAEKVTLAEGKLVMTAPASWKRKQPRVRIIEHEFEAPSKDGVCRVTVMGAGGDVKANIARWISQFTQADGGSTKKRAKQSQEKVAGQTVHLVDISGNFKDQRGPFSPVKLRADYRMLGAIIVTDKMGKYFVKLYGPKKAVAENERGFRDLVGSLKVVK